MSPSTTGIVVVLLLVGGDDNTSSPTPAPEAPRLLLVVASLLTQFLVHVTMIFLVLAPEEGEAASNSGLPANTKSA